VEKIEVMASSDTERLTPNLENHNSFPNVVNPVISSIPNPELIILDHQDFKKLNILIREEEEAKIQFDTAFKRRDKFCVELEKKHCLSGFSWEVDHKKGAIAVTGRREPKPNFPT
jgi:hypothetical protein